MTTLAEFRSNLREMGNFPENDTRITDAVINREVNRALKRIAMLHDWPWLQSERLILTSSGLRDYALPADFLRLLSLRYDGQDRPLTQLSVQDVDRSQGSGGPAIFGIWGGKVCFAPTPNGQERLMLRYICQEVVLVNDSDVPLIPDYWNDGVYQAALMELHRQVKQLDESGLAESRFGSWLNETQDNVNQTRQPVRVRVRPGSLI